MKRLFILILLLMFVFPAAQAQSLRELLTASPMAMEMQPSEVYASWQGETLNLMVERALCDQQALALSWQITPNTAEACYLALEKVYVNGLEVPMTRSVNGGANWLQAHTGAGIFDMSQVPPAQSYQVVVSFLSLKPAGQVVYLPETDDNTDYIAYQQKIIEYNNQGCVVSTPEGRIQLSQDSYDPSMTYVYQLMAADKVTPWENPAVTFTLTPTQPATALSASREFENYGVEARLYVSPLSLSVTLIQRFSNTLSQAEAESLLRRYAVLDARGQKDWYGGGIQEMGELTRLGDGSYQAIMTWSTQSLKSLPDEIRLTPYSYDAYMSPVYEADKAIGVLINQ